MPTLINAISNGSANSAAAGFKVDSAAPTDVISAKRVIEEALSSSSGIAGFADTPSAAVTGSLTLLTGSTDELGSIAAIATNAGFASAVDDTWDDLVTLLTA